MIAIRLILPALLMLAFLPYAEIASARCGMGVPSAGNPMCIPPDVLHNPAGIQQPQLQEPVPQVTVIKQRWADRWGAISADGIVGSLGFVTGYPSKMEAERAAVQQCRDGGGSDCRNDFSFRNGCAAFVISDDGAVMVSAEDEDKASDLALSRCNNKYGDCRVYSTACSHAEAVPVGSR